MRSSIVSWMLFSNCPANGQEPKTGQRLFVRAKVQSIRGKLLEKEFIVRQIVIERANHVIAIREGKGTVGLAYRATSSQ